MDYLPIVTFSVALATLLLVSYQLYVSQKNNRRDRNTSVFVDTSVLIDARIVSIAKTGFVPGKLIIPRSVIGELQFMADNADNEKRAKARRGLDVIKELQETNEIGVEILQDGSKAPEGVDERLLALAKQHGGFLCTIDYNLNKVAQVEGITVLNVNELAQQIRIVYLPGDQITVLLTQKGQDNHQAVGHLEDGTMVVVEKSNSYIGKTLTVEVVRSLQTAAGRMIFAKRVSGGSSAKDNRRQQTENTRNKPKEKSINRQPRKQRRTSKGNKREDELLRLVDEQ